jgi:hypothetical protein
MNDRTSRLLGLGWASRDSSTLALSGMAFEEKAA